MNFYDNIPTGLKEVNQWILWRLETREGSEKPAKVPYQINGYRASPTNSNHWATFKACLDVYQSSNGYYTGLGLCLSPPLVAVDMDDNEDLPRYLSGDLNNNSVVEWVSAMNYSYTEISQSGNGLHIFGILKDYDLTKNRNGKYEIYNQKRFIAITGNILPNRLPASICSTPFDQLKETNLKMFDYCYRKYIQPVEAIHTYNTDTMGNELSEKDIIIKAIQAKNGERFKALFLGDLLDFPSESEARASLINSLIFWTGGDLEKVESIMQESGRNKDKWNDKRSGTPFITYEINRLFEQYNGNFYKEGA